MLGTTAAIFSALLVATGMAKVVKPFDTARAIRAMGLQVNDNAARLLGLAEISIGVSVLVTRSAPAYIAQGVMYLSFLVWIVAALRRSVPVASCGCLGTPDTPPYWGHIVVNVVAVASSIGAGLEVARGQGNPGSTGFLGLIVALVGGALAWMVIGEGARLAGVRSR
ncbi:MAG TPA: MauE/DoxX family redox-associated membrane protein [Acidimicrobiia bacterium]